MIITIVKLFGYMVAELLPLGGEIHFKLMNYYFKYPLPGKDALIIIHVILTLGLCVYFIKDILRMLGEFFKGIWIVISGRATIKRTCTDFKMLNMFLATVVIAIISYLFLFIRINYDYPLYLIGLMLILSAAVLRLAEVFTLIKIDARVMNVKESFIFGGLQALSMIPGVARAGVMMSVGKFLGIEKKHLAKLIFISLIPVLIMNLVFVVGVDPVEMLMLLYHSWLICLILFVLLLLALDIVFVITTSPSYYKFYYYLAVLGAWTILDVFFAKRGL